MSEVKRYGYLGIVEEEDGEVVKWEDYAALKAERDALAAENARCKFEISRCHQAVDEMFKQRGKWVDREWLSAVWATSKRLKENTPATDAYLNSVRAEGVEMLAAKHQAIVDTLNGDSLFADGERRHASIAAAAVHFAAQLRAGKDGE